MNNDPGLEVAVFTQAIRLPAQDRAGFLAEACASDGELRRKVEELLKAHDRVGNFLEEPSTGSSIE